MKSITENLSTPINYSTDVLVAGGGVAGIAAALAAALEVDTEAASAVPTTIIIITVPDSEADGITIPTAEVITDTAAAVSAVLCLQF